MSRARLIIYEASTNSAKCGSCFFVLFCATVAAIPHEDECDRLAEFSSVIAGLHARVYDLEGRAHIIALRMLTDISMLADVLGCPSLLAK